MNQGLSGNLLLCLQQRRRRRKISDVELLYQKQACKNLGAHLAPTLISLLVCILMASSPESSKITQDPEITTVDVHVAKDLIRSGHRYVDVRTEEEFKRGHVDVENPLNIPYMLNTPQGRVKNPDFLDQVMSVCDKEDGLVVGCQSGVRSVYATTDLLKADFKNVSNMGGGYLAWVENGFSSRKETIGSISTQVPGRS